VTTTIDDIAHNGQSRPSIWRRLRIAVWWLLPAFMLLLAPMAFGVRDVLLAMSPDGLPPTRAEIAINVLTAVSIWFGAQAVLSSLVWDDSPFLGMTLVVIMAFQLPFSCCGVLSILF